MKTAHLPTVRSHKSSYQQHHCHKYCNYHQSDRRNHDDCRPDYCHWDNQHHDCPRHNSKDSKSSNFYKKKDDCRRNHFTKKSNKAMHNDQSSLSSTGSSSRKRSRFCSRSPLRFCPWSRSQSSSRSYENHHVDNDDCRPSGLPKHRYLDSSKSDDGRRIHHPDKSNTVFATFAAPTAKQGKGTHK